MRQKIAKINTQEFNRYVQKEIKLAILGRNDNNFAKNNKAFTDCKNSKQTCELRVTDNAIAREYFERTIYKSPSHMKQVYGMLLQTIKESGIATKVSRLQEELNPLKSQLERLYNISNQQGLVWIRELPQWHAEIITDVVRVASFDETALSRVITELENAYEIKNLKEYLDTVKIEDDGTYTFQRPERPESSTDSRAAVQEELRMVLEKKRELSPETYRGLSSRSDMSHLYDDARRRRNKRMVTTRTNAKSAEPLVPPLK